MIQADSWVMDLDAVVILLLITFIVGMYMGASLVRPRG